MPFVQMSYIGWSEDWLENGDPIVGEAFIKSFVNRYFAYPEDWDDDDVPLIMFWERCVTCGVVQEHFMKEKIEAWENYIYNWDNRCHLELCVQRAMLRTLLLSLHWS